ncbi:MAG: murein biosynthesis integral membrane protein MurJ [Proteobacteria bacterium]|nr:murein biosynthesis integral membrane protein MurJ [Pseudomonadota bacterium]
MSLVRAVATVGANTLASRLLGFLRDVLIAALVGTGLVADAFFVAFKLPNFFRRLFAEGAFNAAFVPLFARELAEGGPEAARRFAEEVLAVLLVALLALVALVQAAMPLLMYVFAPGFAADAAKFDLAVRLTRLTFPYLLFISLVSLMGGVLNGLGRFAAAAATPILLNLALIGALLGLAPLLPTAGHALAWGVAGAGVLQFLWLALALRRAGMELGLSRPRLTPPVRRFLALVLPGAVGAGVVQINLLIDVVIASLLPTGSISYLFFADRVNQLPIGVVGVAVGTALLPMLTRELRAGGAPAAAETFNRAIEMALLLTLPAAAALIALAHPVVSVLFERGAFGAAATAATAAALVAYSCGLPAYVLIKVLAPGFFAREDTATPVKVGALCVVVNLALNLALMGPLRHVGIALATAISAWINIGFLATILIRRRYLVLDRRLKSRLPRIALASAGMAALLLLATRLLAGALAGTLVARAGALALLVAGGLVAFALLAWATGAAHPRQFLRLRGGGLT